MEFTIRGQSSDKGDLGDSHQIPAGRHLNATHSTIAILSLTTRPALGAALLVEVNARAPEVGACAVGNARESFDPRFRGNSLLLPDHGTLLLTLNARGRRGPFLIAAASLVESGPASAVQRHHLEVAAQPGERRHAQNGVVHGARQPIAGTPAGEQSREGR